MSAFTPTTRDFTPPHAPDWLASATLTALLRRAARRRYCWGAARTLALGLPSLGVLPALLLPSQLLDWCEAERVQVRAFLEWLNRERQDSGVRLIDLDVSVSRAARWLSWGASAAAFAAACLFAGMAVRNPDSAGTLYVEALGNLWRSPRPPFTIAWMSLITAAYAMHLLATIAQTASTRELLRRLDAAAGTKSVIRVDSAPRSGTIPWLLAGAAGIAIGAWWAIPMTVAAGAHADYVRRLSCTMRAALADYMRQKTSAQPREQRERILVPQQVWPTCANVRCEALVPMTELRCVRCGTTVNELQPAC
jgi:hypothetical protein